METKLNTNLIFSSTYKCEVRASKHIFKLSKYWKASNHVFKRSKEEQQAYLQFFCAF